MSSQNNNRFDEIVDAVSQLAGEIKLLINALDELREEVQWNSRNSVDADFVGRKRFRLTSMSLDPTAKNWRVNGVDESLVEQLRNELSPPDKSGTSQTSLF